MGNMVKPRLSIYPKVALTNRPQAPNFCQKPQGPEAMVRDWGISSFTDASLFHGIEPLFLSLAPFFRHAIAGSSGDCHLRQRGTLPA